AWWSSRNRGLPPARGANAAIVSDWPVSMVASSAANTRRVLSAESSRRSSGSLSTCSAMVGLGARGAAGDGREEHRLGWAGQALQFGGEADLQRRSLCADGVDGFVDGGPDVVGEAGDDFIVGV